MEGTILRGRKSGRHQRATGKDEEGREGLRAKQAGWPEQQPEKQPEMTADRRENMTQVDSPGDGGGGGAAANDDDDDDADDVTNRTGKDGGEDVGFWAGLQGEGRAG
ncbi:hypothetical protein TRV_06151 [Trichophyton verrucosum HKI 0517]|uniref:Uncharacterized protein n=1 Tax=Trichophyton verrucosum (strain HKI 0517) TaxID=663202 RepID=D4DG49_TRIVH|nr:uncharacterized protein TRV_06151 [Trichophyton verrucosum HKI 0517]EFE39182.1 hypothetical protein TRV_06151 [Trichophyton verrucosum HKI 0517]